MVNWGYQKGGGNFIATRKYSYFHYENTKFVSKQYDFFFNIYSFKNRISTKYLVVFQKSKNFKG